MHNSGRKPPIEEWHTPLATSLWWLVQGRMRPHPFQPAEVRGVKGGLGNGTPGSHLPGHVAKAESVCPDDQPTAEAYWLIHEGGLIEGRKRVALRCLFAYQPAIAVKHQKKGSSSMRGKIGSFVKIDNLSGQIWGTLSVMY